MTKNNKKEELLLQRYGVDSIPKEILWNNQIEALLSHRSVRKYLPDSLPEGAIETIVAAAQSASNSSNLNQWSVIAITDVELKKEVARTSRLGSKFGAGNPYIEQAPVFLLWIADMYRNNEISSKYGNNEVQKYTDALLMASIDTAIASQNAVVAAESLGLGVVYIGAMRNNAKEIAALLNLPDYSYVVFGMVLGIPDPSELSSIRPRLSQKAVLHYNGYDKTSWIEEVPAYEKAFLKFRQDNNLRPQTWQDAVRFSSNDMTYMEGRQNLRQTLEDQGFELL
jgi:nitroreductase